MSAPDFDVLIIGAGISGISMAAHLGMICPEASYAVFERRKAIGGTWDLFRYPGVRSDSDMHTLGFAFAPWREENAIADGDRILAYLERVAEERGIVDHIYFDREVLSADWDADLAQWRVTARLGGAADTERQQVVTCRWLYFASGYYDYDAPHDPQLPGIENFGGTVVQPQFWPEDLDYAGKRVVVIGSGATAVTIVPAMAEAAAHVTMLQRTPTWMAAGPRKDRISQLLLRFLPETWAYWLTRQKNIFLRIYVFRLSRRDPGKLAATLTRMLKQHLGEAYDPAAFTPPYNPWQQRLCLVPDGDLFEAMKAGKASVVTGEVAGFDDAGIQLASGASLPADVVVTATGLRLVLSGKVAVSMGGEPVDFTQRFFYRGTMFSNVPNLSVVFGYLDNSWTLRADHNARFAAEAVAHMRRTGSAVATPLLAPADEPEAVVPFDYTSGYLQRALPLMPKSAAELPWRLNHDYYEDARDFRSRPVSDGVLRFTTPARMREPQ